MGDTDSTQQYRLRWNNHSTSMVSEFESLLGLQEFVDVTISCEKRNFKAHRVVLSACSAYFRKLLKDYPCQHPIIIINDVCDKVMADILHFMYHGNVMVEKDRIPKLLQMAQMLEVRGLCDIKNSKVNQEKKEEAPKINATFSGGLLSSNAAKRPVSDSTTPQQVNAVKRLKTSPAASRPVPMLQSILKSQQIPVKFVDTSKLLPGQKLILKAACAKLPIGSTVLKSTIVNAPSMENLGGLKKATNSAASISSEGDEPNDMSLGDTDSSLPKTDHDTIEVKEEPLVEADIEFIEDSMHGDSMTGGEFSESEADFGGMSERSALQLLSSSNILSATAKLKAAVSQAARQRSLSNDSISFPQLITVPSTSPDMSSSSGEVDPLGGDMPRKLAFHEPRPCPICRRVYRDAATLRTHTAIMHAEGRDPFACMCGELFRTKYEMYNHKKNGHR